MNANSPVAMIASALFVCAAAFAAGEAHVWWNPQWRYRTRVSRPTPYRSAAPRPAEAAVDFSLLLQRAGVPGDFDPASVRVVHGRDDVPCAYRTEYDARRKREQGYVTWLARAEHGRDVDIYFDTKGRGMKPAAYAENVPPENLVRNPGFEELAEGKPVGWGVSPSALVKTGQFEHTTGERSLKIVLDQTAPKDVSRSVMVEQSINVAAYAGQEMVFECDLMAERAEYGAPVRIELQQLRKDGSRIAEFAVQSRWLTIELAEGQLVQFSQRGRFSHEAATLKIAISVRLSVRHADTNAAVTGPESFFTIWLDRVVVRPGERWPWPVATNAGFVEGALTNAPLNRAFEFTGRRRLAFNGGSEGALQAGRFDAPDAAHWGVAAGTVELWCKPNWSSDDGKAHVFLDNVAYMHRVQARLEKLTTRGKNELLFTIADSNGKRYHARGPAALRAGQWHHIAATWDFARAHIQFFLDGKPVASRGPGDKPWPHSTAHQGDDSLKGMGIDRDDKRSVPMQAYLGGTKHCRPDTSADAAIDEFRVSDVVRYTGPFTPSREEFETDAHTRALFHFENEEHGVHGGDDEFVRGHLACEQAPQAQAAALEIRADGKIERREVVVAPYPSEELFEKNRADRRLMARRPVVELPDPRFVECREREATRTVRATGEEFALDVAGDHEPLMRCTTFELADEGGRKATLLPRWRANDNVAPFSVESLRETLAPNATDDAERAFEVFKYSLLATNYYDAHYCETFPEQHRKRVSYTLIKELNIYPFDQCGPMNHCLRKMFLAAGISSNNASGTHHQFEQAFYDGGWRLFDLSGRLYWLNRDNVTVAGRDELEADLYLKIRLDEKVSAWIRGRRSRASFGGAVKPHSMDFPLRPGERVSVCWHNEGRWFERADDHKAIPLAKIPPLFGNGAIVYEPTARGDAAAFENVKLSDDRAELGAADAAKPAMATYSLRCPYILSDGRVRGRYNAAAPGAVRLRVSLDRGKHWRQVWANTSTAGDIGASLLDDITAHYEYLLKLELAANSNATVHSLRVRTTFVVSALSLPGKLRRGSNRVRFVAGPVSAPVKTTCRWVERHASELGVALNAITYYMNSGQALRRVIVAKPGEHTPVQVRLLGGWRGGRVAVEGLPEGWLAGPAAVELAGGPATAWFEIMPQAGAAVVQNMTIVAGQGGRSRRVQAQLLVADAALVREAEAADAVSGAAAKQTLPEASRAAIVAFQGDGSLAYDIAGAAPGKYALWLRARWEPGSSTRMTLKIDDKTRRLRAQAMIGFTDWTDPRKAHTKMFAHFGEQYGHWSWYRVPDVTLGEGKQRLVLEAGSGARVDALLLLPQEPAMDRAAMNLFMNWNYAPWQNPM